MELDNLLQAMKARQSMPSSTPQFKCEKCKDSGWIEVEIEPGVRAVKKCGCQLAREAEDRLRRSGLAGVIETQTFDTFIAKTDTQKRMKALGQQYINDLFDHPRENPRRPWLYIGGNPGSGKTHICTAVCGEILKRNVGVRYMQWVDTARQLKASVNDEDFEDLVADYINVSVLYVDDLLKQKYTDCPVFTEADIKIAFTILNARYLLNKPTVISSEWDLVNQLLPADEGVFSRVYERSKAHRMTIERDVRNNFRLMA
jgi:DNA replication protein DnaC